MQYTFEKLWPPDNAEDRSGRAVEMWYDVDWFAVQILEWVDREQSLIPTASVLINQSMMIVKSCIFPCLYTFSQVFRRALPQGCQSDFVPLSPPSARLRLCHCEHQHHLHGLQAVSGWSGLATNSILFCWLFTRKDQCKLGRPDFWRIRQGGRFLMWPERFIIFFLNKYF